MNCRVTTGYEYHQWQRYIANPSDESLILRYRFELHGHVNLVKLNAALRRLLTEKFSRLSSRFVFSEGQLFNIPIDVNDWVLHHTLGSELVACHTQIKPDGGALFYFQYIEQSEGHLLLELAFSHCVFDGSGISEFIDALENLWRHGSETGNYQEASGQSKQINLMAEMPVRAESVEFWKNYLEDVQLTYQFQNLPLQTQHSASEITIRLEGEKREVFTQALADCDVSLFQGLAMIFAVSVAHFDGQLTQEICLAHTANVRPKDGPPSCWSNLIPLCIHVEEQLSWHELSQIVKRHRGAIRSHQAVPTLELIGLLSQQQIGESPFNLILNESAGLLSDRGISLDQQIFSLREKPSTSTTADLALTYYDDGEAIIFRWNSNGERFSAYLLNAFSELFTQYLLDFAQDCDARISALSKDITSTTEATSIESPASSVALALESLFSPAFTDHAERIAVVDEFKSMSYAQLAQQCHQLGAALNARLDSRKPVGLLLPRTNALVVCYLTCIQQGLPFVPLDPSLPVERLNAIRDAAQLQAVISTEDLEHLAGELCSNEVSYLCLSQLGSQEVVTSSVMDCRFSANDLAYMMFTSGSTGIPKGVKISRANLAGFLNEIPARIGIKAATPDELSQLRIASVTAISFDISLLELLLPLTLGHCVVIACEHTRKDAQLLAEWIQRQNIQLMQATPSTWRMLAAVNWQAKQAMTLLSGGEALTQDIADFLVKQPARIFNMYGPTEATVWSSCTEVSASHGLTLGKPLVGTSYRLRPVPDIPCHPEHAALGELIICGSSVGLGYANAPDNKTFFIGNDGSQCYATGDLVRRVGVLDADYVFLRRIDKQLKFNGYRIELDEINHALAKAVASFTQQARIATFSVLREKPNPMLCGFVWQAESKVHLQESAIIEYMARYLPSYMLPSAIYELETIPVTSSGKANVKALAGEPLHELPIKQIPQAQMTTNESNDLEAQGSLTEQIQCLVHDVLKVRISDIERPLGWYGLNSVSYNLLAAQIRTQWKVEFASFEFYRFNTLKDLVETLAKRLGLAAEHASERGLPSDKTGTDRTRAKNEKIAIIGFDALLPNGVNPQDSSIDAFWDGLLKNQNAVSSGCRDSYLGDRGLHSTLASGEVIEFAGAYLPNIAYFDAKFFSISPLEATRMDPRQRLLLQSAWRCIEHAGYASGQLEGSATSCYVASTGSDYALQQARAAFAQNPYALPGHSNSILANRISAFLDFRGPSNTVDTACSGSLVAIVKAVRDLQSGVADYALAGGVSLIMDTQVGEGLLAGNFMSPNSRCASFDQQADGYVRGEGVGLFLLKPLKNAQADRDAILGVIEAVAENHGGRANSLTAPNPAAQASLLQSAYTLELASKVSYIETHGTGTQLGDPIELSALQESLASTPNRQQTIWLGAVKSQIGHLEPAAGVASLVKVLLALKHQKIPANLHFSALNAQINLQDSPFQVVSESVDWCADEPRVAGISSFGFGGANAHIVISDCHHFNVLNQHEEQDIKANVEPSYAIPLSAKDAQSLQDFVSNLASFLSKNTSLNLADAAFSLGVGRGQFAYRTCLIACSIDELVSKLKQPISITHCPVHEAPTPIANLEWSTQTATQLSALFLQGHLVDWQAVYEGKKHRRIHLPTYHFSMKPFWFRSR